MMDVASALHPWNRPQVQRLAEGAERLSHALLLTGPKGVGKMVCADHVARWLLCLHPTASAEACGECQSCRLRQTGSHPDLVLIAPAEAGKAILVDQIRSLADFLYLKPHTAARKLAIIAPAEDMNINAANSLLKMLEEPPTASYLILVATHWIRLPATIRSRCTRVPLHPPRREEGLAWLHSQAPALGEVDLLLTLANGAPLEALNLAQSDFLAQRQQLMGDMEALVGGRGADPLECAARWKTLGAGRCAAWLEGWLQDLIRLHMAPDAPILANPDAAARLQALQKQLNLRQLFRFYELVVESHRLLGGPLDELLLLEDLLIRWTRLTRP